jgi:hypothetical protein
MLLPLILLNKINDLILPLDYKSRARTIVLYEVFSSFLFLDYRRREDIPFDSM